MKRILFLIALLSSSAAYADSMGFFSPSPAHTWKPWNVYNQQAQRAQEQREEEERKEDEKRKAEAAKRKSETK